MRETLGKVFVALLLLPLTWSHKSPQFADNRSTMVHLFEWTWKDIARECEEFLGPQGYGGVQVGISSSFYVWRKI